MSSSSSSAAIRTGPARGFATREPNLLNVAVTRAKRRLYVIGNRNTWGNEPYFNVLAARIPTGSPSDIG